MPGHEFENKVQKQLEELNLPPSGAVWNRVEQEIRRDKRRRRLLLFLPLLLLLGIGVYWATQPSFVSSISKSDKNIQHDTKNSVSDPAAVIVAPSGTPEQNSPGKGPVNLRDQKATNGAIEEKAPIVVIERKSNSPVRNNGVDDLGSKPSNIKKQKVSKAVSIYQPKDGRNKKSTVNNKADKITGIAAIEEKPVAVTPQDKSNPTSSIFSDSAVALNPTTPAADQPKDSIIALENKSSTEAVQTSKVKPTNQQSKSWKWGIVGGIGVSKVSEGGLFNAFGRSQMMDLAYNGTGSIPPPPTSSGKAASINPGINWNAGVFVQRTLNKKLQLSAALQYNYFCTNSNIGTRVDSPIIVSNSSTFSLQVEAFYLNNAGNTNGNTSYRSMYHFLELPITLQFQLNNNKKTPFYWNNGFSIAQLLSTSALQYDGSTSIYYKDDNLFRKTQLGIHTGLSIKLFTQSKYPLELGPQFNYQFTNLLKAEDADKRHLLSGSLLLRWYIKK